jgi:hypothetical protein
MRNTLVYCGIGLASILCGFAVVLGVGELFHYLGLALLGDHATGIFLYGSPDTANFGINFFGVGGYEFKGIPGFFMCDGQC